MTATAGPRIVELCAGYGGLGMGLEAVLGGHVVWVSEFEDAPSKVLAHHWPDAPNHGDLTVLDWASMPPCDVLAAGFPCQPFSHAGKRLGANDSRHLWPYIQHGISILRPGLVVLENVRGLLSGQGEPDTDDIAVLADRAAHLDRSLAVVRSKLGKARREQKQEHIDRHERDSVRLMVARKRAVAALRRARRGLVRAIGAVTGGLADVGYDAWWVCLRAADVGAAHGRFRVFIFAWPADAPADPRWFLNRGAAADGHGQGLQERRHEGGVRAAVREQGAAADGGHPARPADGLTLLPTPAVNDMGAAYTPEEWDAWTARMKAAHGNGNGHGKSLEIEAQRLLPTPEAKLSDSGPDYARAGRDGSGGDNLITTVARLFPTPRASDGEKGGPNQRGSSGDLMLPSAVQSLLPTPSAASPDSRRSRPDGSTYSADGYVREQLGDRVLQQDWREYGPAIRRWENTIGRAAPSPTEPGAKGQPRLSPRFVEWMMGLPPGHVTDPAIGITRNEQLKALGNGVVPQQAAAATVMFLRDLFALVLKEAA